MLSGKSALALPLVLLLLLGGLSGWIERTVRAPAPESEATRREPVSIVENFRALKTGPDGRVAYRLEARTLKHYDAAQPSELVEPRLSQRAADGVATRASAQRAELSADGASVTLMGRVRLAQTRGDAPGLAVATERLVLRPDSGQLSAPGPVVLEDRLWRAEAGRMEFDSTRRVVKLSGRVRAVYRHAAS
jgi:LPS export ABC transporter protein LptC